MYDFREEFKKEVIQRFIDSYEQGITPNPCVECNRYLKFDHLYTAGKEIDQDYIATGHYAIIEQDRGTGRYLLKKSADLSKDQSYVLYAMTQEQLAHTRLPLGGLAKSETREIAEELGLRNAAKRDSQDICFVPDGDYASFIEEYTGQTSVPGDFVNKEGKVLGTHKGHIHYTIGQRRGLGISAPESLYVCAKSLKHNQVILGGKDDLMSSSCLVGDINLIPWDHLDDPVQCKVKNPLPPAGASQPLLSKLGKIDPRYLPGASESRLLPVRLLFFMTGIRYLAEEPYWRRMP